MSRLFYLAAAAALFFVAIANAPVASADVPVYDADIDNDGVVSMLDLAFVVNNPDDARADLNGDGHVGFFDVAIVAAQFGDRVEIADPSPTPVESPTSSAPASPTPALPATFTLTPSLTATATRTFTSTLRPTRTPSPTPTLTASATPSLTSTFTPRATATATALPPTPTSTSVPSTNTPTPTPTRALTLATRTFTATATKSPTPVLAQATKTPVPPPPPVVTDTPSPVPPTAPTQLPAAGTRDVFAWPCASTSIWNMPIGSGASYVPAGLQNANAWSGQITTDAEFIGLNPDDPLRSLGNAQVHVPQSISWDGLWNGVAAFLASDGHSVLQGQPLILNLGGSPSWQYSAPTVDVAGDCIQGAHGGSGLSSFGGSLRKGELSSSQPLRHALKINVYAKRFLSCEKGGFRWPAIRADSYMDCSSYGGDVAQMRMGSLVALPPGENCDGYGSARARKICQALQDYGAYIVDDTFWDVHAIDIQDGAEFSDGGSFHADLQDVFTHLAVVDNNSSSNIGGGGTPRQPLAPPIGD